TTTCSPGSTAPAPRPAGGDAVATRALERGTLERQLVARAEVLETDATGVLLRTAAFRQPWPQAPFPPPPDDARPLEGRLRIEAVSDAVLRVRYAPGLEVRDGGAGMLKGAPPPAAAVEITTAADRVTVRTPAMTAVATLAPLGWRSTRPAAGCRGSGSVARTPATSGWGTRWGPG
ncbi:MAG TPA: hypothetical protein VF880_05895, partial [Actinomycetes bacterium]